VARYKITFVDKVTRTFEVDAESQKEAELLSWDDAVEGSVDESWEYIDSFAELATPEEKTA